MIKLTLGSECISFHLQNNNHLQLLTAGLIKGYSDVYAVLYIEY